MAKAPSSSEIRRKMRAAQRKAEREVKRDVDRYNQKVDRQNRAAVAKYNREVDSNNRAADRHNKRVVAQLNRQLQGTVRSVAANYSPEESVLAERVQEAIAVQETREYDIFLSYARIDGFEVARKLREYLHDLGVSVWFDEIAIIPGKSQALQMDRGLRSAKAGVALLTPAYLTGRFWTERELGSLLHKETLIPVLHGVTWKDVAKYSGILPDLAGFSTENDSVETIAEKIAVAVLASVDK